MRYGSSRGGEEVKHLTQMMMETAQLGPETVAHTILTQAGKGRFRIYVPGKSKAVHWFSRMFPNLFLKVKLRMASKREQFIKDLEHKYEKLSAKR